MKIFSTSKATAVLMIASPIVNTGVSAFPIPNIAIVNWLAGRNLEQPPAVAAEIDQFPKFIPRTIVIPRNHTNGTFGNATDSIHPGSGYYREDSDGSETRLLPRRAASAALSPLPIIGVKPHIQDVPKKHIEIPSSTSPSSSVEAIDARSHDDGPPSFCPDCHL